MKVLIIRFSSIGDIVLITPVIRCLYLQRRAEIHWLTKDKCKHVLQGHKMIHRIWSYEQDRDLLMEETFDFVLDLQKNWRSYWAAKRLTGKYITYSKQNVAKFFITKFGVNCKVTHIVDRYFEALAAYDITNDGKGLDFPIVGIHSIQEILPHDFIAINIGGTYYTKRIPVHKVLECVSKQKLPVVLLGGTDVSEEAVRICRANPSIINMVGKLNLNDTAWVISQSQLLITSDSALMHIGAACGVPMEVWWGNTHPSLGMYPYLPVDAKPYLDKIAGLSCQPCMKIGSSKCPKGHFRCMNDMPV